MIRQTLTLLLILEGVLTTAAPAQSRSGVLSGETKTWQTVTVTFDGPQTSEDASPNPFTDYALTVTFASGQRKCVVPGYYAADGDAGQTGAKAGNKWRVHFTPDQPGTWTYAAGFRTGANAAIDSRAGRPCAFDGAAGTFDVAPADPQAPGFAARGALRYVGRRYLQFAGTGEYFLKAGADSPENFLAYADFDDTYDTSKKSGKKNQPDDFLHRYQPHEQDFRPGDSTWRDGKGKGIIGAINYLASKGMNSVYFITYNLDGGDGHDVWPWTGPRDRTRFDCSKLDQWEILFSHMERRGVALHVLTQETENDQGLDGGDLGPQRRLYYRELISRFGHHLAVVWNLGEENTNTDAQRKAFAEYIRQIDPYAHPIVVHTFPNQIEKVYTPLLGFQHLEGPSIQIGKDNRLTHAETVKWIDLSAEAGRPWFVCLDEQGPADTGAKPDRDDSRHDDMRRDVLWGNLMAGGAGVEWYFGYKYAHNDLNCEDWRSRDALWDQTRFAVEFFRKHLPFAEMTHADERISQGTGYCLAKDGEVYAAYLPRGGTTKLKLPAGGFTIQWYNPRRGGALLGGTTLPVIGGGEVTLGPPPAEPEEDWVVLVRKAAD